MRSVFTGFRFSPSWIAALAGEGIAATLVGEVLPADGGPRYIEGALGR